MNATEDILDILDEGLIDPANEETWSAVDVHKEVEHLKENVDAFFLVIIAFIIFFMQCGFAFLEAGSVRSKNTTNILIKNMLDVFIGGIAYWLIGYPLAFGKGNAFAGASYWASVGLPAENYSHWFFHFVFAATAATIVSGSMAERCALGAYFVYSVVLTAIVYPIVSHWAWSEEGWLGARGYEDYAGSGVVHLTGGTAALVGCVLLGSRLGRFGPNSRGIKGHSVPLAALGGFILLFGFLAFNGGSQASISHGGDAEAIARSVLNTVIGGCTAGITSLFIYRIKNACSKPRVHHWSFLVALNGALTGMVSMCAGCNAMEPWFACLTGFVAGIVFLIVSAFLVLIKVDDPLDAVAVHGGGGFWGLLAHPLFMQNGIVMTGTAEAAEVLVHNLTGAGAIIAWTGIICIIMFGVLRLLKSLRVDPQMEIKGLDILKHGEPAYPADSWQEEQYLADDNSLRARRALPPNMSMPQSGNNYFYPGYSPYMYPQYNNYGAQASLPHYPAYCTLPDPRRKKRQNQQNGAYGYAGYPKPAGYVNDGYNYTTEEESNK